MTAILKTCVRDKLAKFDPETVQTLVGGSLLGVMVVQPASLAEDHAHGVGDRLTPAQAILGLAGGHRKATELTLDREPLEVEPGATAFGHDLGRFRRVKPELDALPLLRATIAQQHERPGCHPHLRAIRAAAERLLARRR